MKKDIEAVDLFCGVGGLTCGLRQSGIKVKAGFDVDKTCKYAYETNNKVEFNETNIRDLHAEDIVQYYNPKAIKVLAGCAPCQPFSQMQFKSCADYNYVKNDKHDLLLEFGRIIEEMHPDIVAMENVPRIRETDVYEKFYNILERNGYNIDADVAYCPNYGIAQNRRRFILVASRLGKIKILKPTHSKDEWPTVRDVIGDLPSIKCGEKNLKDPLHTTAKLSEKNLKRIRISKPGGTWKDWPFELRCKCHQVDSGSTYTSVYGRMEWDKIAPTMTTQFYCYGTGRYGHPEQDRALTLREGALIQSFPKDYQFIDPNKKFVLKDVARHIGNAVPVRLGEIIGLSIKEHIQNLK